MLSYGCIDIVFINGDPPMVVGPWVDPFIVCLAVGTTIVAGRVTAFCVGTVGEMDLTVGV